MLHPQHKYSLGVYPASRVGPDISESLLSVQSPGRSRSGRKQLWSLSPTAFHQSFDDRKIGINMFSNSCGNINEQVSFIITVFSFPKT